MYLSDFSNIDDIIVKGDPMSDQPINEEELKAIEARLNAATPGPWETEGRFEDTYTKIGPLTPFVYRYMEDPAQDETIQGAAADVEFIVHVPDDVRRLIAEVQRLRHRMAVAEKLESYWRAEVDELRSSDTQREIDILSMRIAAMATAQAKNTDKETLDRIKQDAKRFEDEAMQTQAFGQYTADNTAFPGSVQRLRVGDRVRWQADEDAPNEIMTVTRLWTANNGIHYAEVKLADGTISQESSRLFERVED